MTEPDQPASQTEAEGTSPSPSSGKRPPRSLAHGLIKLARPHQWVKSGFVLLGPMYGMADIAVGATQAILSSLGCAAAFALVSSSCYAVNDVLDAPRDRFHPRKKHRPVASGVVSPAQAWVFAAVLAIAGFGLLGFVEGPGRWLAAATLGAYLVNVTLYSTWIKRIRIADVLGLSLGFVLRVFGGCVAVGIWPSAWLMNVTLFLAMFLSFGKRLGERGSMGEDVGQVRIVQRKYTIELLRMAVVVTGVATLLTYASYIQDQQDFIAFTDWFGTQTEVEIEGFNLLWLTIIPATYGLLRCIVLLEQGVYDDPTELAIHDRPFQIAGGTFVLLTIGLIAAFRLPPPG